VIKQPSRAMQKTGKSYGAAPAAGEGGVMNKSGLVLTLKAVKGHVAVSLPGAEPNGHVYRAS